MMSQSDANRPALPDTVERTGDGFAVPAELIGPAFGMEPAHVPELMRSGAITSRCETGVEDDAGRWRITIFHAGRALRLTVTDTGHIVSRATFDAPRPAGKGQT